MIMITGNDWWFMIHCWWLPVPYCSKVYHHLLVINYGQFVIEDWRLKIDDDWIINYLTLLIRNPSAQCVDPWHFLVDPDPDLDPRIHASY